MRLNVRPPVGDGPVLAAVVDLCERVDLDLDRVDAVQAGMSELMESLPPGEREIRLAIDDEGLDIDVTASGNPRVPDDVAALIAAAFSEYDLSPAGRAGGFTARIAAG